MGRVSEKMSLDRMFPDLDEYQKDRLERAIRDGYAEEVSSISGISLLESDRLINQYRNSGSISGADQDFFWDSRPRNINSYMPQGKYGGYIAMFFMTVFFFVGILYLLLKFTGYFFNNAINYAGRGFISVRSFLSGVMFTIGCSLISLYINLINSQLNWRSDFIDYIYANMEYRMDLWMRWENVYQIYTTVFLWFGVDILASLSVLLVMSIIISKVHSKKILNFFRIILALLAFYCLFLAVLEFIPNGYYMFEIGHAHYFNIFGVPTFYFLFVYINKLKNKQLTV